MLELVLYLCWRDTDPWMSVKTGPSPVLRYCAPEAHGIRTGDLFAGRDACVLEAWRRVGALIQQSGWRDLYLTYECQAHAS